MKKHKKRRELNDLLLPVIFILAILPFISHLVIYDSGLSKYPWFSSDGTATDFFSYYKSQAFIIAAVASAVILAVYSFLRRKDNKSWKAFIPAGIYAVLVLLSSLFSVDRHTSFVGGFGHFENALVLLGYPVITAYSYQIRKQEGDYKSIFKAIFLSLAAMCLIGILQIAGKDLMSFEWFQKIVIPRQYWKEFIGKIGSRLSSNAVSLTLFNPNFAAVYLGMMIPFLIAVILPSKTPAENRAESNGISRRERLSCIILIVLLTVLLYKTYSRTGLVSVLIALLIPVCLYRRQLLLHWRRLIIAGLCAVVLFAGIDYFNEFRYITKIIGTVKSLSDNTGHKPLEEIVTKSDGIIIRYNRELITVSLSEEEGLPLKFLDDTGADITDYYDHTNKTLNWTVFTKIKFSAEEKDNNQYINCLIDGITWKFIKNEKGGYLYVNGFGKTDELKKAERFGFRNTENIGSGRGYIWSRSIPLLKHTILLGTGPDTFLLVFPQSDYVGKANNCKTPNTIIEKPHNLYLMTGIQTGLLSLIALLCFCIIYLAQSLKIYKKNDLSSFQDKMGFGCFLACVSFMVSGLFNDSSLQTSPIFFVLLGLGMDINEQLRKAEKL